MRVKVITEGSTVTTVDMPDETSSVTLVMLADGRNVAITDEGSILVRDSRGKLFGYNIYLPGLYTANRVCPAQASGSHIGETGSFEISATHVHSL